MMDSCQILLDFITNAFLFFQIIVTIFLCSQTELYRRDILQFKRLAREHALTYAVDKDISSDHKSVDSSTSVDVAVEKDIEEQNVVSSSEGVHGSETEALAAASASVVGEKRSVVLEEFDTDEPRAKDQKL